MVGAGELSVFADGAESAVGSGWSVGNGDWWLVTVGGVCSLKLLQKGVLVVAR